MRLSWNDENGNRRFDDFEIRVDRIEVKSWFPESDSEPTTISRSHYRLFRCINRHRSVPFTQYQKHAYLVEEITEEERELFRKWFEQDTGRFLNGRK